MGGWGLLVLVWIRHCGWVEIVGIGLDTMGGWVDIVFLTSFIAKHDSNGGLLGMGG